jgi:hypothetical protein
MVSLQGQWKFRSPGFQCVRMEAVRSFETFVPVCQSIRCSIAADSDYGRGELKFRSRPILNVTDICIALANCSTAWRCLKTEWYLCATFQNVVKQLKVMVMSSYLE